MFDNSKQYYQANLLPIVKFIYKNMKNITIKYYNQYNANLPKLHTVKEKNTVYKNYL